MLRSVGLAISLLLGATAASAQSTDLTGVLRRISGDSVVIQAGGGKILTVALGITTKYYKGSPSGAMIVAGDFRPGDHLSIEATQDAKGAYRAQSLSLLRPGTPEERAAASKPLDASQSASQSASATQRDASDSAPPQLRRGIPPRGASSANSYPNVANNDSRPSIRADDVSGVTRRPDAPNVDPNDPAPISENDSLARYIPRSGDPVIDKARQAAFAYSQTLPNFVVKEYTTRYGTEAARAGQTNWHAFDTVTADLVSENGQESYKNVLVNGHPPKESVEKTGTWSTGAYSGIMIDVLAPGTHADFRNKRPTTINNRDAWLYDFSVEKQNSHWEVQTNTDTYIPAYTGSIWIDKENSRALRVELSARGLPTTFLLDTVENAVDYDFVLIGESRYMLPVHSEALSCERSSRYCSRNVIDFRNYKKFTADTSITFDSDSQQ